MSRAKYIILLTLAGLVILTVLAILGANLGFFPGAQQSQLAKWGPAGALAEIIALFSFVAKFIFAKPSFKSSLVLGPPQKPPTMREFDISRIQWTSDKCFVLYGQNKRKRIKLVPYRTGAGFRVLLPEGVLENATDDDPLELDLTDKKGNRWCVEPFLPAENVLHLSVVEEIDKLVADYQDEEE